MPLPESSSGSADNPFLEKFPCPDKNGRLLQETIRKFQELVLGFYHEHGRPMAWRETTDPYCILVSEIMLQQTQVERVAVKYPAFIAEFPDFSALASAPLPDVLSAWQGMGYNRRAIALRNSAQKVVAEYGGKLPEDPEILATFPGIGKATSSSIAAFAFNAPVTFIETNIRRVFLHFFFGDREDVSDREIHPLVEQTLYRDNPRVWYWALMDLGTALKKTGSNPNLRSRHYTRQSKFEGSDRQIRGAILREVLGQPGIDRDMLLQKTSANQNRAEKILNRLLKEGFIRAEGERVFPGQ